MVKSNISTTLTENLAPKNSFIDSFFNMSNQDMSKCTMFTLKLVLFIILVFILMSCLTSCIGTFFGPSEIIYTENFDNNEFYSYKDTINPNYSNYQTTALTIPETPQGTEDHLLFGQANRTLILNKDGTRTLFLDVLCSLNTLNGNPFAETNVIQVNPPVPQQYLVYIKKHDGTTKLIDSLSRNSDNVYKLKFQTSNIDQIKEMFDYNEIQIVYTINNSSSVLLAGKF